MPTFMPNSKQKNKQTHIRELENAQRHKLTEYKDLEQEVLSFYT